MSSEQGLAPNVIIAGVSKCGTTSLFRYLASHPDVCASAIKEINFFTRVRQQPGAPDLSAYAPYFERCANRPFAVFLEASPTYLYFAASVAPAIKATLPRVRLIFLLRDPVARFVSHYRYLQLKAGAISEHTSPDDFLRQLSSADGSLSDERLRATEVTLQECVLYGLYADDLQRFLELFGADRVFVGYLEHLEQSPSAFMKALCAFLGISAELYDGYRFSVENRRRHTRFPNVNRLAETLTLRFEPVFNRYPAVRHGVRRVYFGLNPEIDETAADKLTVETEAVLRRYYAPSVYRLRRIMERWYPATDVPDWVAACSAPE